MTILDTMGLMAKYIAILSLLYVSFVVTYRIFLHPLRNYPGPLLAKVSDIYAGYFAVKMSLHLTTYSDLKHYGTVIRHGPNKLIFNSAAASQDIYNTEKTNKSRVYLLTVASGKPSIFSMLDKRQHRIRRKIMGQAVNDKAVRAFEPTMTEQIEIFIQQLWSSSRVSDPVNVTERCKWLGMDIVGHLAFGYALNLQTDPTNRYMTPGLAVSTYQFNCFMQCPLLKTLRLHHLIGITGTKERLKYAKTLHYIIRNRLSEPTHAHNDLYSFVADHLDNASGGIQTSELWSEAVFFFPAAGDTTTTAISALFFYLSRNPIAYKKLATEIRSTFRHYEDIRGGQQLTGCRYLRACIDEALRMSPPASGTLWREPYNDGEPIVIDGHVIPPGTQVGVSAYSLHHNETYFAKPFEYDPDRWLIEDEAALSLMHSAFTPFSLGARGCAGKSMAYLETGLVIAKTIWLFDFEIAPGKLGTLGEGVPGKGGERGRPNEFQLYDTFGSRHDGPNLIFRLRVDQPSSNSRE
ncbi:cytochrome P450 [Xylaria digitata]|nr:cytochrome P450 [Xylaria digitata]